jgi:hypothetical protein
MRCHKVALRLAGALLVLHPLGCGKGEEHRNGAADPVGAIRAVLAQDEALGADRNHAPESQPISQAIRDYVAGLQGIDFGGCPEEFTRAFRRHIAAWQRSIPFFAQFDHLRGEMHDIFESIRQQEGEARAGLESAEEDIWGTWDEVEAAARRAGAISDLGP